MNAGQALVGIIVATADMDRATMKTTVEMSFDFGKAMIKEAEKRKEE